MVTGARGSLSGGHAAGPNQGGCEATAGRVLAEDLRARGSAVGGAGAGGFRVLPQRSTKRARSGDAPAAVGIVYPADRGRSGVSVPQERSEHPTDLALVRAASGSARAGGVFGLLPMGLFEAPPAGGGAKPDPVAGVGSTGPDQSGGSVV